MHLPLGLGFGASGLGTKKLFSDIPSRVAKQVFDGPAVKPFQPPQAQSVEQKFPVEGLGFWVLGFEFRV